MDENNLCLQAQFDEIEALRSIYGDDWKTDETSPGSYAIEVAQNGLAVSFYVHLGDHYPISAPPTYTLSAPSLTTAQKRDIAQLLDSEYLNNIGESVIYQWVEKIREYLIEVNATKGTDEDLDFIENAWITSREGQLVRHEAAEIMHGDVLTDRKSSFQGHVAVVHSVPEVHDVIKTLKTNRKIANATHNIYAYRISLGNSTFAQDCDDDGESQAGGRLLHLLQIVNVQDVVVVVSRWYGGIHLGADRFRHINNAARQVLQAANLLVLPKT